MSINNFNAECKQLAKRDWILFLGIIKHFTKAYKFKLLFIYIVYFIGVGAIFLANFNYCDDIERNITGAFGFEVWSRYLGNITNAILQVNSTFLLNIFPYSLFVTIFILSLSSLMLVVLLNKSHSNIALIASVGVGLFPYFLSNISFRYDSPFMALSIFFSILPFMFLRLSNVGFMIVSIISISAMLTSYQASSGIYIVISVFLIAQSILNTSNQRKKPLSLLALTATSFILACLIFKVLMYQSVMSYANNEIIPMKYFAILVYKHIYQYLAVIYIDFKPNIMIFLILASCFIFIVKSTLDSNRNKILAFIVSLIALIIMAILSYGIYIIILKPLYSPRALIGIGVLITLLIIYSIDNRSSSAKISSSLLGLIYASHIITFANYYGNTLNAHKAYETFRITMVMSDLAKFLDDSQRNYKGKFNILVMSENMLTPEIVNSSNRYPVLRDLIPKHQDKSSYYSNYQFLSYGISSVNTSEACNIKDIDKAELLVDNYFHTIRRVYDAKTKEICYIVQHKYMDLSKVWGYFY